MAWKTCSQVGLRYSSPTSRLLFVVCSKTKAALLSCHAAVSLLISSQFDCFHASCPDFANTRQSAYGYSTLLPGFLRGCSYHGQSLTLFQYPAQCPGGCGAPYNAWSRAISRWCRIRTCGVPHIPDTCVPAFVHSANHLSVYLIVSPRRSPSCTMRSNFIFG